MAYNPFSFASGAELMPVWDVFGDSYESFIDTPFNIQIPVIVDSPPPLDIPPISPIITISPETSSSMISEQYFPNPTYKWEHPLPMKSSLSSSAYSEELDRALALSPFEEDDPPSSYHNFPSPTPQPSLPYNPLIAPSNSSIEQLSPSFKRIREDDPIDCIPQTTPEMISLEEEDDPTGGFKLPASKTPIMEAMVVCALNGWGIDIIKNTRPTSTSPAEVVFRVSDFNRYYKISRAICSKHRPTDDLGSRIKSLRRWFVNFPKKKDRVENSFLLIVKPTIAKKVNEIIERNSRSMGLVKRRRKQ